MAMFSVTLRDLQHASGLVTPGEGDSPSPVCSMSPEHYRHLTGSGIMQLTSCLDKKCERVMGFIRVVPDEGINTQLEMEDPFFAVVYVLDTAVNPDITKLNGDSHMLLVPQHASGQSYIVTSELPATAAINVMFRFAAKNSKMILVRVLLLCVSVTPMS